MEMSMAIANALKKHYKLWISVLVFLLLIRYALYTSQTDPVSTQVAPHVRIDVGNRTSGSSLYNQSDSSINHGTLDSKVSVRRIGRFDTYVVYSPESTLIQKIQRFNEFLTFENINMNQHNESCDVCQYPCTWLESTESKARKNEIAQRQFSSNFDKFKPIRDFTYKTRYPTYKLRERGVRDILRLNYITGGGKYMRTYLLSWRQNEDSMFWPHNASYFNSVIMNYPYYQCYTSARIHSLGEWGIAAGSLPMSLCALKCADNINDIKEPALLAPSYAISDYTETGYMRSCKHIQVVDSNETDEKTQNENRLMSDIITALDVVTIGGMVTKEGHIYTRYHQLLFSFDCPPGSSKSLSPKDCPIKMANIPFHQEVFILTARPYESNYYHFFVERFSRLAAFADFLRQRPSIVLHVMKIFVNKIKSLLPIFNLTNEVVFGPVHAQVFYMPHGMGCHDAHLPSAQLNNVIYRRFITERLLPTVNTTQSPIVLIIKRTTRAINHIEDVAQLVRDKAKGKDITVEFYDDKNLPNQNDTMLLFNRASLIIGPHGAGLSNLLFAKPGTSVIEIHCVGSASVRLSFLTLAVKLGMRYYATFTNSTKALSMRCNKEGVTFDMNELGNILDFVFTYV